MASILDKISLQDLIFQDLPRRHELAGIELPDLFEHRTIRVHRNHSFEHVGSVIDKFLGAQGIGIQWQLSDYDDSLNFIQSDTSSDAEIIWLDYQIYSERLSIKEFSSWLIARTRELRHGTDSPILILITEDTSEVVAQLGETLKRDPIPGVHICSDEAVKSNLGEKYFDIRASRFSGTRLSDRACILLAREFSYKWLYACWHPRLKAVAVDLDHTLYSGVLGEDGHNVEITPGHKELQNKLLELKDSGMFLVLVSRNEESDVRELFRSRKDIPLQWDDFHVRCVSWDAKSDSICRAAAALKISESSFLFIDDNPGELVEVHESCPEVKLLHAGPDATQTARALECYPGLFQWGEGSEADHLRGQDIRSDQERNRLLSTSRNKDEYLRTLGIELEVLTRITGEYAPRIHQMSQKTNQFNLNFQRLSEVATDEVIRSEDHGIALIRLKDRLSDSGIIGMAIGKAQEGKVVITELTVSCRALGRHIEDILCGLMIDAVRDKLGRNPVSIQYETGPRNAPGLDWLSKFSGQELEESGEIELSSALDALDYEKFPVAIIHH